MESMFIVIIVLAIIFLFVFVLSLLAPLFSPSKIKLEGGHALITGGSSGIGKSVAVEAAKRGANVTILARNERRLSEAKQYIENFLKDKSKQKVLCISLDISEGYESVDKAVKEATEKFGPVTMLVNCAGYAIVGRFDDLEVDSFKKQMDINYLGSVYATKAVIKDMKEQQCGRIVYISSQAGQVGVFGFTAYCGSKFALRGFAEALQMEVLPYKIHITVSYPPDTDTPGLALENVDKPKETKLIAQTAGLFQPEYVAKCIVDDAVKGKFISPIGLDGWMVGHVTSGMSPVASLCEVLQQVMLMGLFRAISLCYLASFNKIVRKCKEEKEKTT